MSSRANMTWDEVINELWPDTKNNATKTYHPSLRPLVVKKWEILLPPAGIPNRNGDVFTAAALASLQKQIENTKHQEGSENTMLKTITLQVDQLDYDAIASAIKRRESWSHLPENESDIDGDTSEHVGLVIAEICRGWEELHDQLEAECGDDNPTVQLLRRLFAGDPNAITCLLTQIYVPCNQTIIDDPHAVAHATPCAATPQSFMLGALGLINGVLAANGLPAVATRWTDGCGGQLIGFQKYKPDETANCAETIDENNATDEAVDGL